MKYGLVFIFAVIVSLGTRAQGPSFEAVADTNAILIGEQITLTLKAKLATLENYSWPAFPDTTEGLELVEVSKIDTVQNGESWILEQKLTLTSFDSGYFAVPPLNLVVNGQNANSDPIGIAVRFPQLSEEQGYYDIKKPLEVPINWWRIALWAGLGMVILILIIWLIRKLGKKAPEKREAPELKIPPPKYALLQLAELEREELWQKGELKAYYSRLIDILRLYLERQMNLHAMEKTAEEIISDLKAQGLPEQLFRSLQHTLRQSAMVKYAREKPGPGENEAALKNIRDYVEHTRPKAETVKTRAHVE